LPADLRSRLEASLTTAGAAGAGAGANALPHATRRRLARTLVRTNTGDLRVLRIAAVVLAVLLLAGGLAFAATTNDGAGTADDLVLDTQRGAGVDQLPQPDDAPLGAVGPTDDTTATTTAPAPTTTARPN